MGIPTIYPSPDGSIDLTWKVAQFVCILDKDDIFIQDLRETYNNEAVPLPSLDDDDKRVSFIVETIKRKLCVK